MPCETLLKQVQGQLSAEIPSPCSPALLAQVLGLDLGGNLMRLHSHLLPVPQCSAGERLLVRSSNYSHLEEFIRAGKTQEGWNSLGRARFIAAVGSVSPAGQDSCQGQDQWEAVTWGRDNPHNLPWSSPTPSPPPDAIPMIQVLAHPSKYQSQGGHGH